MPKWNEWIGLISAVVGIVSVTVALCVRLYNRFTDDLAKKIADRIKYPDNKSDAKCG